MNKLIILLIPVLLLVCPRGTAQNMQKKDVPRILVDQLGYLPDMVKVAIIKNPYDGYDAEYTYKPSEKYCVVNAANRQVVFEAPIVRWVGLNQSNVHTVKDPDSGDQVWKFDFTNVTTPGEYYIADESGDYKSYQFSIGNDVYKEMLRSAVRSYYFQRCGMAKTMPYVEDARWEDLQPSYLGSYQDTECQRYDRVNAPPAFNKATLRDLRGGWYDAGDLNKYVNSTHIPLTELLMGYEENPNVWGDDYNIPESGNGIPDLLDEIKWELDWLLRMQEENGSLLSVVGGGSAGYGGATSPVSKDKAKRCYGLASTSATLTGASVFAYASKIYASLNKPEMTTYATVLKEAAIKAWNWADANPSVTFFNSGKLAAGEQELPNDMERLKFKLAAAVKLYDLTQDITYHNFFLSTMRDPVIRPELDKSNSWLSIFGGALQQTYIYYPRIKNPDAELAKELEDWYIREVENGCPYALNTVYRTGKYAYPSYIGIYVWGSNYHVSMVGNFYWDMIWRNLSNTQNHRDYYDAAAEYLHYLHGLNPMNFVFFSNTFAHGGDNGVTEFFHSWFSNGTEYQNSFTSTKGHPPGYLVGGCNHGSGNSVYTSLYPPLNQPPMKSYRDYNNWDGSYAWSENSIGYTTTYIRLISKFLTPHNVQGSRTIPMYENSYAEQTPLRNKILDARNALRNATVQSEESKEVFSSIIEQSEILMNHVTTTLQELDNEVVVLNEYITKFQENELTDINNIYILDCTLYPTITSDFFQIELPEDADEVVVSFFNTMGQCLFKEQTSFHRKQYDVSRLQIGVNFVSVTTKGKKKVFNIIRKKQ